jgi:dehydrogenase/reductase SDR family protein 7B
LNRVKNECFNPERITILPLDFNDPDNVLKKTKEFVNNQDIKVDILMNNAGASMRAEFLDFAFENEKQMMNVNYLSQVAISKVFLNYNLVMF